MQLLFAQPSGQQSQNIWSAYLNLRTDIDILLTWQNP